MSPADLPSRLLPLTVPYALGLVLPLVVVGLVVGLATGVPVWLAAVVGVGVGVAMTIYRLGKVDEIVLDALDVTDADDVDHARVTNLLESLSLSIGVPVPALYLTDDTTVNAAAVQGTGDSAAVVTAGAVDQLDRLQLEGLLAEVIVRIHSGDAQRATVAAGMVSLPFSEGAGSFLHPFASALLTRLIPGDRELVGDMAAIALTRYPPGLRQALALAGTSGEHSPGTAHLWIVPSPPYVPDFDLDVRLAALNEF